MLGSRAVTFSSSSSTERWPCCEKKVSTIRSRCLVALSPCEAIHDASRSWAAAVEVFRVSVRFILKLILNLETNRLRFKKQQRRRDAEAQRIFGGWLPWR